MLCRISESCPNLVCIVSFHECACRTNCDTLTAADTSNIVKVEFECLTDVSLETSFVCTDNSNFLVLVASSNASAAEYTLVVVTDEVRH